MLYAGDLVIIAESFVELDNQHAAWKCHLEGKRLRVNLAKTKVIVT